MDDNKDSDSYYLPAIHAYEMHRGNMDTVGVVRTEAYETITDPKDIDDLVNQLFKYVEGPDESMTCDITNCIKFHDCNMQWMNSSLDRANYGNSLSIKYGGKPNYPEIYPTDIATLKLEGFKNADYSPNIYLSKTVIRVFGITDTPNLKIIRKFGLSTSITECNLDLKYLRR